MHIHIPYLCESVHVETFPVDRHDGNVKYAEVSNVPVCLCVYLWYSVVKIGSYQRVGKLDIATLLVFHSADNGSSRRVAHNVLAALGSNANNENANLA